MKANEVMLGDWVYNEVPCYVTAIYPNGTMDCQGDDWAISTDRVEPIPLTEEILEKNGFEKCKIPEIEYIGWRLNEEFSVELNAVDDFDWNDVHIAYVHQLQHALRLCGIKKEIEI